jgi:dihydrofolate reductase
MAAGLRIEGWDMGQLIMWNLVSVDGCFEGETPWSLEWFQRGFTGGAIDFALDQLRTADVLVFGRKTYEGMFDYWPSATGDIAELMNTLPKIVFSRTLSGSVWNNTRMVADDPARLMGDLKQLVAQNILIFGSAELSMPLMNANLFDEYRLGLTPVVLGRGRRLFGEGPERRELELIEARSITASLLLLRYSPTADRC